MTCEQRTIVYAAKVEHVTNNSSYNRYTIVEKANKIILTLNTIKEKMYCFEFFRHYNSYLIKRINYSKYASPRAIVAIYIVTYYL